MSEPKTIYMNSGRLNLPFKILLDDSENITKVIVKDNEKLIEYFPEEIEIIDEMGEICPAVHMVKKVFKGTIIRRMTE